MFDPDELAKHIDVKLVCGERINDDEIDYIEVKKIHNLRIVNDQIERSFLYNGPNSANCMGDEWSLN